jgi:disulfide bond formation protein DsbB
MIEPCRMCWYQRMALFPLTLILGIGIYRHDRSMIYYALPLSIFGMIAALSQSAGIHFPFLQICSQECAKPIFSMLDAITFPDLSALGFAFISFVLLILFIRN